jgi:hypothetical protein
VSVSRTGCNSLPRRSPRGPARGFHTALCAIDAPERWRTSMLTILTSRAARAREAVRWDARGEAGQEAVPGSRPEGDRSSLETTCRGTIETQPAVVESCSGERLEAYRARDVQR